MNELEDPGRSPGTGESRQGHERSHVPGGEPPGWLDILYGTLFQPHATFSSLLGRPPYGLAFAVFFAVGLVSVAVARQLVPEILQELDSFPVLRRMGFDVERLMGPLALFSFWVGLFSWFSITAVYHLAASLLGGQGSAGALFALLGLANLPQIFAAPLAALELNTGIPALSSFGPALDIWRYYLYYRAVRVAYGLTRGRALGVVLAPVALLLVMGVGIALLVGGLAAGL